MRQAVVKGLVSLAIFGVAALPSFPQTTIENPDKPKAANAGRVLAPERVAVISDEGTSDFYFKWPHGLGPGPGGSLLVREPDQILWFDKEGRFLKDLFKKGQGPGEMPYTGEPAATESQIVVVSFNPGKLVYFDRKGRYEKEIAVRGEGRRLPSLIGWQAGRFYFATGEFPRTTGDPDIVDNPRTIMAVDAADGSITPLATFVTRAWVVTSPGGAGGMFDITRLIAVPFGGSSLVLTHTEDYLIKLYDPTANRIVREFRRAYARVKGIPLTEEEKKGGIRINDKHYTRPERKFENDVKNLLVRSGEIWAVTSTADEAKGVLVDVFNGEGVYQDCFWLRLHGSASRSLMFPGQCALDNEFLWIVEKAEDGISTIGKYRVPK